MTTTKQYAVFVFLMDHIIRNGKLPALSRLQRLMQPEQSKVKTATGEMKLDVIFIVSFDMFPDDDADLIEMYANWIEDNWPEVLESA